MEREEMNKNSLEEAARRTCDFEETAMAGVEMAKDPEFIVAINQISKALKKYNRYFIFYTHRFEQGDVKKGNVLITPRDKRFDRVELIGLIVDILRDYAESTGWKLKGSKELGATIEVLKDIYEGKSIDISKAELERLKRSLERDPKYCARIIKRWEKLTGEKAEKVNG